MYNVVHIDEKWFYMRRETQRYYLFPSNEEEPYWCVQNKNFIGKVMFIATVIRPQITLVERSLYATSHMLRFSKDTTYKQSEKPKYIVYAAVLKEPQHILLYYFCSKFRLYVKEKSPLKFSFSFHLQLTEPTKTFIFNL